MKSVILSCPTLKGELLAAIASHNADISVIFLPKELHSDPKYLHQFVQKSIDELQDVDRIYLCTTGCGGRFLTRYDGEVSEPLVGRQGSRVSMRVARASASFLSSHGRVPGTSPG